MPNKELLLQYASLKIEEKRIASQLKELKEICQREVESVLSSEEEKLALVELPGYTFSLSKARPKWEYSHPTTILIQEIDEIKKNEEADGRAVDLNEGKKELRFNQPKGE